MNNWFYMDRMTFEHVLIDELGVNLTKKLLSLDFDTPVSFMIGETPNEILSKIQQTFSRSICGKLICNEHCILCSHNPSTYAKLTWFVQRLLIMSPISKPLVRQTSTVNNKTCTCIKDNLQSCKLYEQIQQGSSDIYKNKNNTKKLVQNSNDLYSERACIVFIFVILISFFLVFLVFNF